MKFWHDKGRKK